MKSYQKELAIGAGVIALLFGFVFILDEDEFAGQGGIGASACTISSQSAVSIGDDVSTEIIASGARNAYAIIELDNGEQDGIHLAFGTAATVGNGTELSSTSLQSFEVGLNTDFPFTGSVNAITQQSSTSVLVTVCKY